MWNSNSIISIFYIIFFTITLWATAHAWQSQAKTETIHPFKAFVHLWVFYACYLLPPLFVFSIYAGMTGYYSLHQAIFSGVLSSILIYARFIEPNLVRIKTTQHQINEPHSFHHPFKIALIADLHVGLFSGNERQLKIIVEKINQQQPDIVVVAGDWTYEPEDTLVDELAILKQIQAPVYSVLGNHDEQYPGPPIYSLLQQALAANNVIDIEGQVVEFDEFRLIGVGDLWAGKTDMRAMPDLPQDKPWVILSHNPDTVDMVPELPSRPLMLSGHTHGGQIELPWVTSYIMKHVSISGHKHGLYQHEHADVYVTVGTGMVGVPFRFRVPPTVDMIELI